MRATINGVTVEGTPAEIAEYTELLETKLPANKHQEMLKVCHAKPDEQDIMGMGEIIGQPR